MFWKSLVGECLQCVKVLINEGDKNAVTVVLLILTLKNRWLAMTNRNLCDCIHVSILPQCILNIFAIRERVNHRGEYGLETTVNFDFYGPD